MRIAHLTATFPPYPGGAGNTAFRFAREQAERGHHVEVFTAPADGGAPDPGGAVVHRIEPGVRDRQRAADPDARADRRLRRRPPPLPVHLRRPSSPCSRRLRRGARDPALLVHYKNRLVGQRGRAGALFETYEHTVAPLLIARRRPRLRALARPRRLGPLPAPRPRSATRPKLRRDAERGRLGAVLAPGRTRPGLRERLGIPPTRWSPPSSRRSTAPTTSSASTSRSTALAALGDPDVHLVVAGGGELLDGFRAARARGRGRRPRPLPRRRAPRRAARASCGPPISSC